MHKSLTCIKHEYIHRCIVHSTMETKLIRSNIQTFILIPKANSLQRLSTRILILKRSWPATSYAVVTFHPTIGQCAHQSLSINATPELGMIPQGTREQHAHI